MPNSLSNLHEQNLCELCGEPMPKGEEMFRYHGFSGNCPKPPKGDVDKSNSEVLDILLGYHITDEKLLKDSRPNAKRLTLREATKAIQALITKSNTEARRNELHGIISRNMDNGDNVRTNASIVKVQTINERIIDLTEALQANDRKE